MEFLKVKLTRTATTFGDLYVSTFKNSEIKTNLKYLWIYMSADPHIHKF